AGPRTRCGRTRRRSAARARRVGYGGCAGEELSPTKSLSRFPTAGRHHMAITELHGADLEDDGLDPTGEVFWQPTTAQAYLHALRRGDAVLAEGGPLVVDTGAHTG